jgi:glyoxylase-like metal-dependent hydrolase (beta-lactamase superfamily II)
MPSLTAPVQLSPHLFVVYSEYPHRDSGNAYLITGRYPTLIDCGSHRAAPYLIDNLAQLGLRVGDLTQVIATHGDYDHIQGYHDLLLHHPDLRLYLHRKDWPIVQGNDPYQNASYLYRHPFVPFTAEQCLPLEDGETIAAGDTSLTAYHTPGHTEGSVSLLGTIDGHEVLFAGDAIGGAMRSLEGAVLEIWVQAAVTWKQSLQRLTGLDFEWVLNGHEPAKTLPLPRSRFDRAVRSFGRMLSPWFSLDDDETHSVDVPTPV